MSEPSPMRTQMVEQGREMKGWWIGRRWGEEFARLDEDFQRLAAAFAHATAGGLRYVQVWNEWRAFYDTRAGHANNALLAPHRRRRHR